jgi:lysophospholipase L1-like esterase
MKNCVLLAVLFLGLAPLLWGQTALPKASYPFVKWEKNSIQPKGSAALFSFYASLDRLMFKGLGRINVVHFGGSHVQADIISGRLRERLQSFYPGNLGSRGLLFPYSIAKTNNPGNYIVKHTGNWNYAKNVQASPAVPLGLTGMAVFTSDSGASIRIEFPTHVKMSSDFNLVRLYEGKESAPYRVLFQGEDSVPTTYREFRHPETQIREFFLDKHEKSLRITVLPKDSTEGPYVLYGIQLENEDPGITYHSFGVNGASTSSYLKCSLLGAQLAEIKPDLVLFGLGINDAAKGELDVAAFKSNYRNLIRQVRATNPQAAILLLTNNDSYRPYRVRRRRSYSPNPNGEVVRKAMFELAESEGVAVWDLFEIMGGLGSAKTWEDHGLAQHDKVHFTFKGYRLLGDMLFEALLTDYQYYLKKRFK